MTYEIRIDWFDAAGKLHVGEALDPRFNVMIRPFKDQTMARSRLAYLAAYGFWREGGRFVAPASIVGGQVKRVAEVKAKKGGRKHR